MANFIHSSDWHLGKTLFARPLLADQEVALKELLARMQSPATRPDFLLLAGDLFDRSVPPEDAIRVLGNFLTDVVQRLKIPVCMIPGNHDSNTRVGMGADLMRASGLHVFSTTDSIFQPFEFVPNVDSDKGKVAIYGIPYLEPTEWGHFFKTDSPVRNHEDALKLILQNLAEPIKAHREKGFRVVLMLHAYVTGGEISESERPLSVGGSEMVPAELLLDFDYVALGHLHRPQKIKTERIRYCGSLFPYSQSEADQEKGVCEIHLGLTEKADQFKFAPFQTTRRLRVIEGALDELIDQEKSKAKELREDYVIALLTDQAMPFEAYRRMSAVLPGLLHVSRKTDWTRESAESSDRLHRSMRRELSDAEVLMQFSQAASNEKLTDEDLRWLVEMLSRFTKEDHEVQS
ncbi:MAG: exonuclease SbcCD subunit D [Bdellovibrionales bacterium]|nr:exonuclease SbcCD subunit D [Bdellovibrionales bacterium]